MGLIYQLMKILIEDLPVIFPYTLVFNEQF